MISELNANPAHQSTPPSLPSRHAPPVESEQARIKELVAECLRLRGQVSELEKERDEYLRGIYALVKKQFTPEAIEKVGRELEYAMAHPDTWTSSEALIAEMESYARELKKCQAA